MNGIFGVNTKKLRSKAWDFTLETVDIIIHCTGVLYESSTKKVLKFRSF